MELQLDAAMWAELHFWLIGDFRASWRSAGYEHELTGFAIQIEEALRTVGHVHRGKKGQDWKPNARNKALNITLSRPQLEIVELIIEFMSNHVSSVKVKDALAVLNQKKIKPLLRSTS